MTAPAINTDLLAYNFNLGTTQFAAHLSPSQKNEMDAAPFSAVGQSFMHELAREGDVLSAEVILDKGGAIDLPDDEGRRPLHEAAYFGRLDMVAFLLSSGAVLDAPISPFGYTALWFAVQQGHHDVVRYLLERGARLETADMLTGQGLLHVAAARGDMIMAGLLIAAGIDVLAEDRRGQTARDAAARMNNKQLENVLLKVMEHRARYLAA
jgi:ankyrin repeat protein